MVCADGGNPDPTTTPGKPVAEAKHPIGAAMTPSTKTSCAGGGPQRFPLGRSSDQSLTRRSTESTGQPDQGTIRGVYGCRERVFDSTDGWALIHL